MVLVAMYQLKAGNAEPGSEWGNHPWSNFCFGIGLFALGFLLIAHNNINGLVFSVLAVCSLLFIIGFIIENTYTKKLTE